MKAHSPELKRQKGFSLLEAIVAITILSVGMLSLAAVYSKGILVASMTQFDYIAEKKAEEAVETIFAARDSKVLQWTNIRNTTGSGGANDGVFLIGPQPLLAAGPDGLYGTADDEVNSPDVVIIGPGPDGILGTADDVTMSLANMTRTITITDIPGNPSLRQIQITINYTVGPQTQQYTLVSYISQFS
jgi:prepilin-type N-terminal cleavage/methylation domain-containing protein